MAQDEQYAQAVREGRAGWDPLRRRGSQLRPQVAGADRGDGRGDPLRPGGFAARDRAGHRRLDGDIGLTAAMQVVLVHGAWADGSSWNDVIPQLLSDGLHVLAAPLPLTTLSDDVAALDRALERTNGPVVLVAHAYAGAVIGTSTNERVRSLVFIAALAPDESETVAELFYREKPHPQAPQLAPDAHGLIWMPREGFSTAFAQHASPERAALFVATQRPIAVACR